MKDRPLINYFLCSEKCCHIKKAPSNKSLQCLAQKFADIKNLLQEQNAFSQKITGLVDECLAVNDDNIDEVFNSHQNIIGNNPHDELNTQRLQEINSLYQSANPGSITELQRQASIPTAPKTCRGKPKLLQRLRENLRAAGQKISIAVTSLLLSIGVMTTAQASTHDAQQNIRVNSGCTMQSSNQRRGGSQPASAHLETATQDDSTTMLPQSNHEPPAIDGAAYNSIERKLYPAATSVNTAIKDEERGIMAKREQDIKHIHAEINTLRAMLIMQYDAVNAAASNFDKIDFHTSDAADKANRGLGHIHSANRRLS